MPTLVACLSAHNYADHLDRVPTYSAARKAIHAPKGQGNQQLISAASAQACPLTANSGLAENVRLDRGFAGDEPELFLNGYGIAVEIVGIKKRQGFQIEPRRWKAEQTFGCLLRYRRLRVDDEMSCESSRGMTTLAALFMTGMRLERLINS
jgi:transposase